MEVYEVRVYKDRVEWRQKGGKRHRLDGPAIECVNGDKHWYQNGKRHRLDGPAVEGADGYKVWYQYGKFHRLDGPAIEYVNGDKYWYQNGNLHRLDGPAIEYTDGTLGYWIEGEELTEEEFNRRTKPCLGKKVIVDGIEYTLS